MTALQLVTPRRVKRSRRDFPAQRSFSQVAWRQSLSGSACVWRKSFGATTCWDARMGRAQVRRLGLRHSRAHRSDQCGRARGPIALITAVLVRRQTSGSMNVVELTSVVAAGSFCAGPPMGWEESADDLRHLTRGKTRQQTVSRRARTILRRSLWLWQINHSII